MEGQIRSEVLKTIPYGFYIKGVVGEGGEVNGFTTCWASQVSFQPQQVILAVRKEQHTHDLVESGGVFSLNFLDTSQEDLARKSTKALANEDGTIGVLPSPLGPPARRSSTKPSPTWSAGSWGRWRPAITRFTSARSPPA